MKKSAVIENANVASQRKNDHIRICTDHNVESSIEARPFDKFHLRAEAWPDFSINDVCTQQRFLGTDFAMPLIITGMTGGVDRGQEINETLALAAQKFQIPLGLGSQKIVLADPQKRKLFDVRKVAPKAFVIGNMGLVSLNYGVKIDDILELVESFELNAFAFHLNALQEAIQPEGERNFSNLASFLKEAVRRLPVPVMVKEVGAGLGPDTFRRIVECGVSAVDVGGQGGTSWGYIEGLRGNSQTQRMGSLFRNWGISTEQSLNACVATQNSLKDKFPEIVATGGIRDGLQVAKAIALGATLAGVGLPLFKAVVSPPSGMSPFEALYQELEFFEKSLKIAMFCSGSRSLKSLREVHKNDTN